MAKKLADNLVLASEILSHLLNNSPITCWGKFTTDDLSDAINSTFAAGELIRLAELERKAHAKGVDENDEK
jgi:hypothetical protein